MCFVLFAAVIFSMLWALQTVFLQRFYNGMLVKNARAAAEEIAAASGEADFTEVIDRLSAENSLLVYVTDQEGTIIYNSDSYSSYYKSKYEEIPNSDEQSDRDGNSDYSGKQESDDVPDGSEDRGYGYQDYESDDNKDYGYGYQDHENGNPYTTGEEMSWQQASYRSLPDGYEDFLTQLAAEPEGKIEYSTESRYVYGTYIELAGGETAVLYTSVTLGAVGATASIIRTQLLWVTLLSLVIAFVIAWFIARRFSVPVDRLSVQAKMLAEEKYEPVFEKGFCRELDMLSESMDETAKKLAEARNYQKELLANVSHDLRTPLTMIKGYAEMVRDFSWEDEEQRNADTGIIIKEADRLTALVNEILEYTSLQENRGGREFTQFDFSALVRKVVEQFEPLMNKEGYVIAQNIEDGCTVKGDAALLERVAYNLVDNALRHSGADKTIEVALTKEGDKIRFEVADHGEGIDESELPYIWEKYYTNRQRGNKGVSGLGLAIVKQIAEIHEAETGVLSKKGEGSRFYILIPGCC